MRNWDGPVDLAVAAAPAVVGRANVQKTVKPSLTAEDFGRYLAKLPGAFFWLGCGREDQTGCVLHGPRFDMDEAALLIGARIMYRIGLAALAKYR